MLNRLEQKADSQMAARLDRNDYDDKDLIEIRIPLNMPYLTTQVDFERCDGQVEINGRQYNYVKRKIDNGQLVLKCIPNEIRQRLQSARDDFFKMVNDLQQDHPAKKSNHNNIAAKNLAGDYDDQQTAAFVAAHYSAGQPRWAALSTPALSQLLKAGPEQPPEA